MKSADWADAENYRNHIVAQLMEFCVNHGLDSTATESKMVIKLPTVKEISVMPEVEKVKRFNHKAWGNIDIFGNPVVDDNMPTEFPPTIAPLEEGVPPKEYDEDDTESK